VVNRWAICREVEMQSVTIAASKIRVVSKKNYAAALTTATAAELNPGICFGASSSVRIIG